MDESSERPSRSRSNTTTSIKERPRPRSRGSTTSLQSVGVGNAFQPTPPLQPAPMPMNQNQMYPQQNHHAGQPMYEFNQSEVAMQQQHNMQPIQPHPSMGHTRGISHHEIRPNSQHGFQAVQPYPVQYQSQIPGFPMHPPTQMQHMRSHSEQYEGSPAPEDSNNESRKKKGTASNLANDQELRRLLQQYAGKNLPEVASEVQKNEGSGGKSEKAKQVFAMLW
jgi:regulatory factor X, other